MTEPFTTSDTGADQLTQPNGAGETLYFRSNDAADTAANVTVSGVVGSSQTSETEALNASDGRVEVGTSDAFKTLLAMTVASARSGDVTLFGTGAAAGGRIQVGSLPADGDDVSVGMSGVAVDALDFTREAKQGAFWIRCTPDVSGSLAGLYFDLQDVNGAVRIWFKVSGSGSAPGGPSIGRLQEIDISTNDSAASIVTKVAAQMAADAHLGVSSFQIHLVVYSDAVNELPGSNGTSPFSVKTVDAGTAGTFNPSSPNEVRIGADVEEAAGILASALNAAVGAGAEWTVQCVADVSGSLNQKYFILPLRQGTVGIWMSNSLTASPPAGALAADFEAMAFFSNNDSANSMAVNICNAWPFLSAGSSTNTATFAREDARPVAGGQDAGNSGFTIVQTVPGNYGSGTSVPSFGIGTPANPYVTGVANGDTVTITDRLACRRQLGWDIGQSTGATLVVQPMIGGVDGAILAVIPAGQAGIFNPITLDTLDLGTATLPAGLAPTSLPVYIGSAPAELHFRCENVVTPIPSKYQWSDDGTVWADGANAIPNLDNNPTSAPVRVTVAERAEFVRYVINSNGNTAATALDGRVNWG